MLPPISEPTAFYLPSGTSDAIMHAPNLVNRRVSIMDAQVLNRALTEDEIVRDYREGLKKME